MPKHILQWGKLKWRDIFCLPLKKKSAANGCSHTGGPKTIIDINHG